MVKKPLLVFSLVSLLWACATFQPQPPSFYIEDLPQSITTSMSLEQRIAADEAWKNLKGGDSGRAEKSLLRLGPHSPVYHLGLGFIHFQAQDLTAAESSFKEALRLSPGLIPAYLGLAQIDQANGLEDRVFSDYMEVLKRDPDHSWVKPRFEALREKKTEDLLAEAKRAFAAGDAKAGKKGFFTALFYSPESVEAHLSLARIYKGEKNVPSAVLHYKAASAGDPKNKAVLREYAAALYETEQFGRSLDVYEQLVELNPQDKEARGRIEDLKNRLGIYELPSLYNDIPKSEAVTREDLAALIAVKFKEVLNDPDAKPPILVDISTSWAAKPILKVTALNILESYENHTFLPRKIVNRAELAETLVRLINILKNKGFKFSPQMAAEKVRISDVPPENYYYAPITQIVAYQIMDLTPQRTFQPDTVVRGQEAVRILDIILALIK
jgi:Tfp pilus assembly protein PilF